MRMLALGRCGLGSCGFGRCGFGRCGFGRCDLLSACHVTIAAVATYDNERQGIA